MSLETGGDDPPSKLEEIFVALSIQEETPRPRVAGRPTTRELILYLSDPDFDLPDEALRLTRSDPGLARTFQALKLRLQRFAMPVAAAASAGALEERRFEGAVVRLVTPSAMPGQTVVIVALDDARRPPRLLLLEGAGGEVSRQALPAPDEAGRIQLLKTSTAPADALFLALLRDPAASGAFLGGEP